MVIENQVREKLLQIGRAFAAENALPWLEPVQVSLSRAVPPREWSIRTNADGKGCNIEMVIREADWSIVRAGFLPR
jgi:hypothetical protein